MQLMPNTTLINKSVLLLVVALISALFLGIIGRFLEAIFLAGLFSAVCHPIYRWFLNLTGNRQAISSLATIILVLFFIIIPVALIATIVVGQATDFATKALPWVQNVANDPGIITKQLEKLPFYERLLPYRDMLTERIGGILVSISGSGVSLLQSVTVGTFNALLTSLLVLYSFFFFLMDGGKLVHRILYYLPLDDKNEHLLLDRFRSVTIATLKGTAVIGFLQGGLAGIALGVCGVPNATFWSVAMMLLSVVPGIGAALVWVPACIYLAATGEVAIAVGLFAFCGLLVGSIDNVLRPKLVGSDTQLHELMIFFSTLGGILTFGMSGFIIGPIIAALFVTVWEIYGVEFRQWLPHTGFIPYDPNKSSEQREAAAEQPPDEIVELAEQKTDANTTRMNDDATGGSADDSAHDTQR
jgi:predicted PurR-regulated permease PerM